MKYKLSDIEKKQVFNTPEEYFEKLPTKIQTRIDAHKQIKESRQIPSWSLAMAASLVLILAFIFMSSSEETTANELLAEVSEDELIAYLDEMELDVYDIASAFKEDVEALNLEETGVLDGIDMENQLIDDVLLEYELTEEYL